MMFSLRYLQVYLLDASKTGTQAKSASLDQTSRHTRGDKWCCTVCGCTVAYDSDKANVDGLNEHVKTNPQGNTYLIRCFNTADCVKIGEPTVEHCWFSGYLWRYAHCNSCKTQLGWHFSGDSSFYGLIKEQIRKCE